MRLSDELAVYAVEPTFRETEEGLTLFVSSSEAPLARDILRLPQASLSEDLPPRTDRSASPPHRTLTHPAVPSAIGRPGRSLTQGTVRRLALAAAGASVSLAALAMATSVTTTAPRATLSAAGSGWSPSGLAFHDDVNADGLADRIVELRADGTTRTIWLDANRDGTLDQLVRVEANESATVVGLDLD